MKHSIITILIFAMAVSNGTSALAQEDKLLVVAGERVGVVSLGMTRAQVLEARGSPTNIYQEALGPMYRYAYGPQLDVRFTPIPDQLVNNLLTTDSGLATNLGIRIGSLGNDVTKVYGRDYKSRNSSLNTINYVHLCYNDGIWFTLSTENIVLNMTVVPPNTCQ